MPCHLDSAPRKQPSEAVRNSVRRCIPKAPVNWRCVDGGYTLVDRWSVQFQDDSRVFVKAATDAETAAALRDEHTVYRSLQGSFLPALFAFEDGELPILILEDLSKAEWPPPWDTGKLRRVLRAIDRIHRTSPPDGLKAAQDLKSRMCCWERIASNPEPFLQLQLCRAEWLRSAFPDLIAADRLARFDGDQLLHLDLRSDNLCFLGSRVVLVDWNHACVGNHALDLAVFLPTLHLEGGPPPHESLPGQGELAAALGGYWAWSAMQPPPWPGSTVRDLHRRMAETALCWAARELQLPSPK